jgi:hypothetical protein
VNFEDIQAELPEGAPGCHGQIPVTTSQELSEQGLTLPQNRSLDRLAAPSIALTLRRMSLSRRGYLYEVALDGEVIVPSSRDPEYDACRELAKRGRRGIAAFWRPDATAPALLIDVERGAQLITKEGAWGVRVVKFTPEGASRG